jgi:hypothetical protein
MLALTAFGDIAEEVYDTYVSKLWSLWHLANGDITHARPPRRFGMIVDQLSSEVQDSRLIDPDAAHIRNARFHRRFSYDPELDTLELWDESGWTATLPVTELVERTCQVHSVAAESFRIAFNCFIQEVFMDVMAPALKVFPRLLRGELTSLERAEIDREYRARLANLFNGIPPALAELRGCGEDARLANPQAPAI